MRRGWPDDGAQLSRRTGHGSMLHSRSRPRQAVHQLHQAGLCSSMAGWHHTHHHHPASAACGCRTGSTLCGPLPCAQITGPSMRAQSMRSAVRASKAPSHPDAARTRDRYSEKPKPWVTPPFFSRTPSPASRGRAPAPSPNLPTKSNNQTK